ncbi:hypothetical protein ACMUBS_001727 [Cronobacter turicensis]|nr:hypothetical protein [Cronobacter turicensis]
MQNDGAQPEAAVALAKEVKAFGLLDGLLLNAGQLLFSSSAGSTAEAFDTRIIMCEAAVLQMAALSLLQDGVSVVVSSSTAAYEGASVAALYAAQLRKG